MPLQANIVSEQTLEVGVNGPDDIARMFIVTGLAHEHFGAQDAPTPGQEWRSGTIQAHVGPTLTTSEFRRATATASLAEFTVQGADVEWYNLAIQNVDADYDDDQEKVQFEYDLRIRIKAGTTPATAVVIRVGFQVFILAAAASP